MLIQLLFNLLAKDIGYVLVLKFGTYLLLTNCQIIFNLIYFAHTIEYSHCFFCDLLLLYRARSRSLLEILLYIYRELQR